MPSTRTHWWTKNLHCPVIFTCLEYRRTTRLKLFSICWKSPNWEVETLPAIRNGVYIKDVRLLYPQAIYPQVTRGKSISIYRLTGASSFTPHVTREYKRTCGKWSRWITGVTQCRFFIWPSDIWWFIYDYPIDWLSHYMQPEGYEKICRRQHVHLVKR